MGVILKDYEAVLKDGLEGMSEVKPSKSNTQKCRFRLSSIILTPFNFDFFSRAPQVKIFINKPHFVVIVTHKRFIYDN